MAKKETDPDATLVQPSAAPLAAGDWQRSFRPIVIPELSVKPLRLRGLQNEQRYALRGQLAELGYTAGDKLKDTDRLMCAKLLQVGLVPADSNVLLFPGDESRTVLMQRLTPRRLAELADEVVAHNDLYNAPGPR